MGLIVTRASLVLLASLLSVPALAEGAAPALELQPGAAHPGDLVMVTVRGWAPCPSATLGERPLRFYEIPGGCRALVGLTVEQQAGPLEVRLRAPGDAGEDLVLGTLEVLPPNFNVRELRVARKFIKPSPAQVRQRRADQRAFEKAWAQPFIPPLFTADFVVPIDSEVTAPFGDLRTFNGKKQSQHYGMDLDGRIGDPIRAANDGVVVMVRKNFASGNTVLLHHGAHLFTAYFHMSKMLVKPGQKVKQGERIGLVGKTGRVTGPHLHFGCKVDGLWVDPASLLAMKFGAPAMLVVEPASVQRPK
ncbi:MAG: M23 family metallopeptidase [Myxococcaceae bacterium]|nr:M23 family metallopeptidase [Myxococcaceae bacterium]